MVVRRFLIVIALLAVSGVSGLAGAAATPNSTTIDTPGDQADPKTDGRFVVWRDYREEDPGAVDIYATDLTTGEIFAVTTDAINASPPEIDDGLVVWLELHDASSRDYDAVGMDLQTGERITLVTGTRGIAISDGWIVWTDGTSLMAKEMTGDDEPLLLATGKAIGDFVIDSDRVAWVRLPEEADLGHWQLETKRLTDDEPTIILEGSSENLLRGLDMAGDILVAMYGDDILKTFDLDAGTETTASLPGRSGQPTTDGQFVVWEERVDGNALSLRGYDLQTHSSFPITTSTEDLASSADFPDLAGGVLVWRQGGLDRKSVV